MVSTVFTTLAENLEPGSQILLSDGLIELRVVQIKGEDVICEIINGGMLGEKKGINLPGIPVKVPALTPKDEEDLIFAIGQNVDTVAVSFVRTAEDVRHVKSRLAALNSDAWVIAKLEKPQAIEHLDSILEIADGIMVARGDLGVEVPPEKVPAIQKHIIKRAAEFRKPVINGDPDARVDESKNPRPTRAEASDVANAIYDGTDAVMLSGETAARKVSGRGHCDDGQNRARDRAPDSRRPGSTFAHPADDEVECGGDDLRVHGAFGAGPGHLGHCDLYRNGDDGAAALEVPSGAADLCPQRLRTSHQSVDAAVGNVPHSVRTLHGYRQAGGDGGDHPRRARAGAAEAGRRNRGRHTDSFRCDELHAAAHGGRSGE